MIKLIKGELKKIFSKKSIYIVTLIFLAFAILTNIIYKGDMEKSYSEPVSITELENINNSLDLTIEEDIYEYTNNLSMIATTKLKETYSDNTSIYIIDNFLYQNYNNYYEAKYISKNPDEITTKKKMLDNGLNELSKRNWQYFTNDYINGLKNIIPETSNEVAKKRYEELIRLENYRLSNNIAYNEDNYLFNAIEAIEIDLTEYYNLLYKDNLTKEETSRLSTLKETMATNNYILDHQKDLNNTSNLNAVLKNFPNEFGLFILIYVIMLTGSIVSEEFNKGTIKSLLTKPYKRSTILTSKLLTILLLIPIIVFFMCLIEIIVGGIILGFDSLSLPVLLYNQATESVITMSIFKYLLKSLIAIFPMYLILGIISFSLSTITSSTSAATTITFLFYLIGNVISSLFLIYDLKILKYFISVHWDFTYIVNFTKNPYNFSLTTSLIAIFLYIVVILCLTYIYFTKKDVKNI